MNELVKMRSPSGEVDLVEATAEALTPLMVRGWIQLKEEDEHANPDAGATVRPRIPQAD